MKKKIQISFSQVTPESAEEGDYSDTGWVDEDGIEFEVSEDESIADQVVNLLEREGADEPSCSQYTPGCRYSTPFSCTDIRTGEEESHTYSLVGFTPDEEEEIYKRATAR